MRGNPPHVITAIKRNTKTRTAHAETRRTPPSRYRFVKFNFCGYNFTKQQGTLWDMSLQAARKERVISSEGFNINVKKIPLESYIHNRKGSRKHPTNKGRPQPQRNINMLGNTTSVPTSS